jgi:4-hydroxy-2-oxoheptanedioate aldolase
VTPREPDDFRKALAQRHPQLGIFLQLRDPYVVETVARSGFDFGILDLEHGSFALPYVADMVRAGDVQGFPLLARLPLEMLPFVGQLLDTGCAGVLCARVREPEEARQVVDAVRYPPAGGRGACVGTRANDFGWLGWPDHVSRAERKTVVGIALEGPEGIGNADAIMSVPGIDVVFVGIFDLAASLGLPGETGHPKVHDAVRVVAQKAAEHGIAAGAWAPTVEVGVKWRELGISFIPLATDTLLWREACVNAMTGWHGALGV